MASDAPASAPDREWRYLFAWSALVLSGLTLTWLTRHREPGMAGFPGVDRWQVTPAALLAPALAAIVLALAWRGWFARSPWPAVLGAGYLAGLAWSLTLAAGRAAPGRAGALALMAAGALLVPLVGLTVRGLCGEAAARAYLPVLALAPYASWYGAGADTIVAVLGAAMGAAGVWASDHRRTGRLAAAGAALAGLCLGTAALSSYAVSWLGFAVVLLYFARRRAALNLVTGGAALVGLATARLPGFGWLDGPPTAPAEIARYLEPQRPTIWWGALCLLVLLLAAGPPLAASLWRVRNTPGWPFLVGAGTAVTFAICAGLAGGAVGPAWLAVLPWLTIAAVAPARQAGPPVPTPLLLVAAGALTAAALGPLLVPA